MTQILLFLHQKIYFLFLFFLITSCHKVQNKKQTNRKKPNVLIIYMDDLGYGDVGYNGGEISTPNIDSLAINGLIFENGYASSATCTPSRYALLTGVYPWRKKERKKQKY